MAYLLGSLYSASFRLDLSDSYFVLLGAGSAMGPFPLLMALGANIIAIDLDRPGIWKRLISVAKNSPGTITFPTKVDTKGMTDDEIAEVAGCNLFTETPEIRNVGWHEFYAILVDCDLIKTALLLC